MSNSPLISYTQISPNRTSPRNASICYITPHCVVGQCTVESLGNVFAPVSRQASSNYGIGYDGRIAMYCPESDRSWCSSSPWNDNRAITIEVASDNYHPYKFNNAAFEALVKLCADICKRNGKKKLLWLGSKEKTLAYTPKKDEMVLTAHRWFAATICPGDWFYAREGTLAKRVNILLEQMARDYLKKGDKGPEVKKMQKMLIALGFSCGSKGADGNFGANTKAAVKAFQKKFGLDVNGLYDQATKKKLESRYKNRNMVYLVLIGPYKYKENAKKAKARLAKKGFEGSLKKADGKYVVQMGEFKAKSKANALLAQIQAKGYKPYLAKTKKK